MLIILEGPDGSGKSTLAEKISQLTGAKILHKRPPDRDVFSEYTLDLQQYRPGFGVDLVCDRWHLGEEVYGPLLRGGSGFDRASFAHIEKTLITRGAVMGVLQPKLRTLRQRLESRGDDLIEVSQLGEIHRSYVEASKRSQLPKINFTEDVEVDFVADLLIKVARHTEEACTRLNPFTTYAGDPHPRWLLLGDRRNPSAGGVFEAAFTPAPGTAGRYLLDSLKPAVLHGCGLANACEEDTHRLWLALHKPPTVTLGTHARDAVNEAGLRFGSLPHPQYIRRFHHSASAEYGQMIGTTLLDGEDRIGWRPQ